MAFFCPVIGSLAQKRNTDFPLEEAMAEGPRRRSGHTNSADQRARPLLPLTTCAWDAERGDENRLEQRFFFPHKKRN